jgi:RNA polymerase sigma factor (TIGR02999 family)
MGVFWHLHRQLAIFMAMTDVTRILLQIESGDPSAAEQLLPLVYDELRKLAASKLSQEKPGQTLQATALVHEAYLRLVENREQGTRDEQQRSQWNSRGHFFAAAAEAMRRILIGQARHKASLKAGGQRQRVELTDVEQEIQGPQLDLIALDTALEELAARDPRAATLVKLRFFAGLTMPEAAQALGVSLATVENDWAYAKCWLRLQISDSDGRQS